MSWDVAWGCNGREQYPPMAIDVPSRQTTLKRDYFMQKEKLKRTGLVARYLGVGLAVELDLGLALDMAGEVTAHAP